jgi:hypothetical protein
MSGNKWILEVYLIGKASEDRPVITLEFENLPQLRIALTNIPNHKYIVEMPAGATAADRVTLLDLRAQGFDIAIRS